MLCLDQIFNGSKKLGPAIKTIPHESTSLGFKCNFFKLEAMDFTEQMAQLGAMERTEWTIWPNLTFIT